MMIGSITPPLHDTRRPRDSTSAQAIEQARSASTGWRATASVNAAVATRPNDKAQRPAGLGELSFSESLHAPPVRCSAWFPVLRLAAAPACRELGDGRWPGGSRRLEAETGAMPAMPMVQRVNRLGPLVRLGRG